MLPRAIVTAVLVWCTLGLLACVALPRATLPATMKEASASFALYWLEGAFDEVLAGAPADRALAGAQIRASGYADCLEALDGSDEAWRNCARQIDPETVLP